MTKAAITLVLLFTLAFIMNGCMQQTQTVQAQGPEDPIHKAWNSPLDQEDGFITLPDGTKKPRLTRVYSRWSDYVQVYRDNSNGCEFLIQTNAAPTLIPGTCRKRVEKP